MTDEEVEAVAGAIWPWMKASFNRETEVLSWRQINKGSAAHEITCDAAKAAIRALVGVQARREWERSSLPTPPVFDGQWCGLLDRNKEEIRGEGYARVRVENLSASFPLSPDWPEVCGFGVWTEERRGKIVEVGQLSEPAKGPGVTVNVRFWR